MRRGNQAAGTRRISFCVALGAEKGTAGVPCKYRCVQRVCSKCGKNTAVCEEVNVEAKSQRAKKNVDLCGRKPLTVNVQT